jgi:hypothetical protein
MRRRGLDPQAARRLDETHKLLDEVSSMLTEMRVRCWAPVKLIGTEVTAARLRQARVDELAN